MEEKIYDRQVTKQSLSMRVVDEKQIGRHFTQSDLAELFNYSPAPLPNQSTQPIKKPEVSTH
jgi:transcriptional regulator ATRX